MGEVFNIDNKFFSTISKIVDCIFVTILWIVCCIPVVTIGAATTALYHTVYKTIAQGEGYVFIEFMHSFKSNFRQSSIVWGIMLVVGAFLGMDAYLTWQLKAAGDAVGNIFYFIILFLIIEFLVFTYAFPYIARFQDDSKKIIKNALFLALGNPLKTILMLITCVVAVYLVYVIPLLVIVAPALYMLAIEQLMESIYKRFLPQEEEEKHSYMNNEEEQPAKKRRFYHSGRN